MRVLARRDFLRTAAWVGAGAVVSGARAMQRQGEPAVPFVAGVDVAGAASLGAHAAAHGVLYGCAVDVQALGEDAVYAGLIRSQCRIVVAENAMKWAALRPTANSFRFDEADQLVAFAESNGIKVRGHNLAWHVNQPKWFAGAVTAKNARAMLVEHIQTVVGRYAGRMHSWDVVNEAVEIRDGRADGLRKTRWLELAGEDYIEVAFQTARAADPRALLTYNDYGIEAETPEAEKKRQAVMQMLRRMVARRVPVDAVGVQSHLSALAAAPRGEGPAYGPGLMRFLAAVRGLGLQVFVTELDVNDRASPLNLPFRDAAVAAMYRRYLETLLTEPAVRAVLTWGITDRLSWLNRDGGRTDGQAERGLPFDAACEPVAAFYAMREAFDGRRNAVKKR